MIFFLYTTHKTQPGILLTNSTTTMSKQTIMPYCKVCHDAGKSDFNHWLMDKVGNITCSYLLSLKCNRCQEKGHTQKYCTGRSVSTTTPSLDATTTRNKEMFCGFCFNFDKNDHSYKTHYVRKDKNDLNSDVTCPRLLATECKFCHQLGHTPNNCKKIHPDKRFHYNVAFLKTISIHQIRDLIQEEYEKEDFWEYEMLSGLYSKDIDNAARMLEYARSRILQLKTFISTNTNTKNLDKNNDKILDKVIDNNQDKILDNIDKNQDNDTPSDSHSKIQKHIDNNYDNYDNYDKSSSTDTHDTLTLALTPKKSWAQLATAKKIPYAPIPLTRTFTTFGITALPLTPTLPLTPALPLTLALPLTPASPTVSKSWSDYDD